MLRFILMLPVRVVCLPILLALKLLTWFFMAVLCMSEWIFSLVATALFIVGVVGLFLISVPHGIVMIVIAALISPFGLPMLAVKMVCMLDAVTEKIKKIVYVGT